MMIFASITIECGSSSPTAWLRRGTWKASASGGGVFHDRGYGVGTPLRFRSTTASASSDDDYDPAADMLFEYTKPGMQRAGWLDKRLLIHRLVMRLVNEGWVQPDLPSSALIEDLAALRSDGQRYALSPGSIRGQPGRPRSGPPPGMLLCLSSLDWGPLAASGRPTLEEAWRNPRRVRWAVEGLIRRRQSTTRASIIHRMCCGRAEGVPSKAGPRITEPPSFWISVFRDVLGYEHSPIVLDAGLDCGARAVATGMLSGVYLHLQDQKFRTDGPLWEGGGEIEPDDGTQAVDVVFADCARLGEFEDAIEEYGHRADRIVGALPWRDREAALALSGVGVVRYRPRPYLGDAVLAVWRPS